ncbi:unnamed protein product [Closterium sp. NIES-53]
MSPNLDIVTQQQLEARQVAILTKIDQLTDRLAAITAAAQRSWLEPSTSNAASRGVPSGHASQEGIDDLKDVEGPVPGDVAAGDETATQTRLADAIRAGGITRFRFRRVPSDYYDWTLEARRDVLGAPSVDHLCKSIVMTNTQAPADVVDCSNPRYSKYYVIVIQYSARLNAEKVRNFVYALNDGTVPKKRINMRLAPEEDSMALTGFEHNAVAPIGTRTPIPVIISDRILALRPRYFWMGGGEVDLKLAMAADDFLSLLNPYVVDCTY